MVGIFKQKHPANLIALLILGIVIKLPLFMHPHPPLLLKTEGVESDGILYRQIVAGLNNIAGGNNTIFSAAAFLLLLVQVALLNRFINVNRMMSKPNYLPGVSYLLLTSLLPEWNYFSPTLMVNCILLYVLSALFSTYNLANAKGKIFNIGLALGIASFLFVPSLVFFLWVLLALAILRPFRLNEWLLCLLGITTPFYFYAVYTFIENNWSWKGLLPQLHVGLPHLKQSIWLAGSVFLIMIPFLLGGYYIQDHLRRMLIHVRKAWSLLLFYLLVAILIPFVNTSDTFENWIMALIPMAAFHGFGYMYAGWRFFGTIWFWITIAFIISFQYWGPGW